MKSPNKFKRFLFWILLIMISLGAVEIIVSVYYFQTRSRYHCSLHYLWDESRRILYRDILAANTKIGICTQDPELGYTHKRNSKGTHNDCDFKVTYTIGPDGERFIPKPAHPVGRIHILGGSFAFGIGVNDEETFAYLLSQHWPDWYIINKAVMGWGTSHAYITLSRALKSDHPPDVVIYIMIPHHITRNYIRKSWVQFIAKWDFKHPHFELVDGKPEFQGIITLDQSQDDYPGMRQKEIELTQAFLENMHRLCDEKQIPFVVVLLPGMVRMPPYSITKVLTENHIGVIDLSEMKLEKFLFDTHPNRNDHKRIADAIQKSFLPELLENIKKKRKKPDGQI